MPIDAIQADIGDIHPIPFQQMPRVKPGKRGALIQAVALQQLAYDSAHALRNDITPDCDPEQRTRAAAGIANLIKAWSCARNEIRVMRGEPLPGSLRPERKAPRRKAQVHAITEAPEQDRSTITERPKESLSTPSDGVAPPGGEGK